MFLRRGTLGLGVIGFDARALLSPRGGLVAPPLNVAVIGLGRAGTHRLREFLDTPGCRVLAVCDPFESRQEVARRRVNKAYGNKDCNTYTDYRDLLRGEDLAAVVIATPDHWHATMIVAAFRAGVDVYCESPLTLTIDEGREVARIEKETGRVLQTGMSWRSDPVVKRLCELAREGRFGKIRRIRGEVEPGTTFDRIAKKVPIMPDGFRYDMWLGPAPVAPYHPKRCEGFRWIRDYAGGRMTEQGLAIVDIAQWALGRDASGPVSVRGHAEYPKRGLFDNAVRFRVDFRYADGVELSVATTAGRHAVTIEGTKGSASYFPHTGRIESELPELITSLPQSEGHVDDFVESVLTRNAPVCPPSVGRRSADICHLANIALRLGRASEKDALEWDPNRGRIEDPLARRLARRACRTQFRMKM
jgi:predicted dehydrogenase